MTGKREPLRIIGKPMPIPEPRKRTGGEWLPIVTNIENGFEVAVNRSYAGARAAIRRLEESGQIARGKFVVRFDDQDGQKRVFIARSAKAHAVIRKRRRHASNELEVQQVVAYIESKPKYEHTLAEIMQEFFGKVGSPRDSNANELYNPALRATLKARKFIEKNRGGRFVAVRRSDGTQLNTFQKS